MSRPANQFGLEQSRAAFQSSLDLIDSWQGEMVVVIIPTREEVYDTLTEPLMGKTELDKQRSARLAMLDLCSELKLSCIDPLADFQTRAHQGEALYYSDDMHLNSAGNAALATIVQQWIESSTIAGLTK
jgi:lysophospholipase L1-like esterase